MTDNLPNVAAHRSFVTGGTGFLGRHVVRLLLERGDEVRALARPSSDRTGLEHPKLTFVDGDVTDDASVRRGIDGCDRVFHLAAMVRTWARDRSAFDRVNVDGLRNVVSAATEAGADRIVYTSTFMALGPTDGAVADETAADRPGKPATDDEIAAASHNDYERTKLLADRELLRFRAEGAPVVTVYPGVTYGPGALTAGNHAVRVMLDFLAGRLPGLVGDGSRRWCYAYIDDVARGHLLADERGRVGERYILGGENVSMAGFIEAIARRTGKKPLKRKIPYWVAKLAGAAEVTVARLTGRLPENPPGVIEVYKHDWAYCSDKAAAELGYTYRRLDEGLHRTLAWLDEQGLIDALPRIDADQRDETTD